MEKETTGGCGVGVVGVGGGFPGRFQERVYTVIPPPLHIAYHLLRMLDFHTEEYRMCVRSRLS